MAKNNIIPLFVSHLGCPHRCSFCNQVRITGRSSDLTADDTASILENSLVHSVIPCEAAFYGGSFTAIAPADQEALLGAVKPYIEAGKISSIRISTRPDCIDEAVIERLLRFHVKIVELGCQSMNDRILQIAGRGHSASDVEFAVRLLKEAGFTVICQLMTGLQESTPEDDIQSARRIADLSPDGVRIYPTLVLPGTALSRSYHRGEYEPQTLEAAVSLCADLRELFEAAGIPVLRYGLQPTEELLSGAVEAGPFHPAFGELVKSEYLHRKAALLLRSFSGGTAVLSVPNRDISAFYGQHRENFLRFQAEFPGLKLKIIPYNGTAGDIRLQTVRNTDKIQ